MKNLKFLLVLMLILSTSMIAQEKAYNPWTMDIGIGNGTVNDPSYTVNTSVKINTHWDAGLRYNFNPTLGLGLRFGRDMMNGLSTQYMLPGDPGYVPSQEVAVTYNRLSLEAFIDVLDVVDIHNDIFTLLLHGGIGGAKAITDYDYSQTMGLFTGGAMGIFKINNNLGIKIDYTIASHIDQSRTLDGMFPANAEGMTSNVHNGSIGVVMYLGSKDKKPADFYYEPPTIINNYYQQDTTIVNNYTNVVKEIINKEEYNPILREYVFFDHDLSKVREDGMEAIYKTFVYLKEDSDRKVKVLGWASDTSSSAEYNLKLSARRCETLKTILLDMGISENRIIIDPSGKDYDLKIENVHDLARRVELLIIE